MTLRDDGVIICDLSEAEMAIIAHHASNAEIGGKSHVRGPKRMENLQTDSLVGQMAQYAGTKYITGGMKAYRQSRQIADTYPTNGDGGYDIPGLTVDFKGSRKKGRSVWDLDLPVRPGERHDGWIYIRCICDLSDEIVFLVGWLRDNELPEDPEQNGPLAGAHVVPNDNLHPLPGWKWHPV